MAKDSGLMSQTSEEAPQCPEDKRGAKYDNNTPRGWLTGAAQATEKPGFDHGGGAKGK